MMRMLVIATLYGFLARVKYIASVHVAENGTNRFYSRRNQCIVSRCAPQVSSPFALVRGNRKQGSTRSVYRYISAVASAPFTHPPASLPDR